MIKFLIMLLLVSCGTETIIVPAQKVKPACRKKTVKQRKRFILRCIRTSGPACDKQPVSCMEFCEVLSRNLYCE